MARMNITKSLKAVILVGSCCAFLLIQNLASRYHNSVYQLTPLDRLQASYESTIASVSTAENIILVDYQNCFDVNVTSGKASIDLSACLNKLIIGAEREEEAAVTPGEVNSENNSSTLATSVKRNATGTFRDLNLLQSWLNASLTGRSAAATTTTADGRQLSDAEGYDHFLRHFNLTSREGYDPINNLNDKYLYLTLKHVEQLDKILRINYSQVNNPVDAEIDRRRRTSGRLTNLKLSEFADITQVRYGAQSCDSTGQYGAGLTAVVFVITKPDDFKIRSLIRKTWAMKFAEKASTVKLYFTFGLDPALANSTATLNAYKDELDDMLVREEFAQFGDIIQWQFPDGYYRLTIKSVAILRWASVYCPRVPAIFKIDADCVLNYDNLVRFSRSVIANHTATGNYYIYGNLWRRAGVIRSAKSKFFTSFRDYPQRSYPDYVGGPWYLAGPELPLFMFRIAVLHAMPALLWEDLYVTGIIGQKLIDARFPLQRRYMYGFDYNIDPDKLDYCMYNRSIIMTQAFNEENLEQLWQRVKRKTKLLADYATSSGNSVHLARCTIDW